MSSCPDLNDPEVLKIKAQREKGIRDDARNLVSRLAVAFLINDEGMLGIVDTALGLDRKAVFIDELKRITHKLETEYAGIMEEFRNRDEALERDGGGGGMGFDLGRRRRT